MLRYVLEKLAQAFFVLFAAFSVTFLIIYAIPGDAVDALLAGGGEGGGNYEKVEQLREQYGLDQNLLQQYTSNLVRLVTGNLGNSVLTGQPVAEAVAQALPHTIALAVSAIIIAVPLGLIAGYAIAGTENDRLRGFFESLPPLGVSFPSFWIGLVLLQIFSFNLGWFPATGNAGVASLVLPAIVLAIPLLVTVAQVFSTNLRSVMQTPYIATARAQGFAEHVVALRMGAKNAIAPVVTVIGLGVGDLLGGAVVTETVFSRQGIGNLLQVAVSNQDIAVVQVLVLLASAIYIIVNFVADVSYPLIDPRLRALRER